MSDRGGSAGGLSPGKELLEPDENGEGAESEE